MERIRACKPAEPLVYETTTDLILNIRQLLGADGSQENAVRVATTLSDWGGIRRLAKNGRGVVADLTRDDPNLIFQYLMTGPTG